ncbi:hypothetical protein EFM17_04060 [Lactobacillus delbrueckii]|nr:hypothetical protein [Lactobacillus delbrueckii]
MTTWANDGYSVWGVWEKVGAYGVCKYPDRWRLARLGSRSMLYLTPQSARRAAMRLMRNIGRDNVKVVRYDTNDILAVWRT